ncbi:THO complex subunit 4-like [Palaemon carinicauda]|uniref:THO complex subunit 4-like n=1 Tax=Palaemon carinicauda TaxID=392227 RepID=UPI0035B655E9
MVSGVDMSLEDIIKTNNIRPGNRRGGSGGGRGNSRGGGRQQRGRGGPGGGSSSRGGTGRPAPRGNIDGRWSHDLFQGPAPRSGGSAKLLLSNLDFGVSEADIHELFSEFGPLRNAAVHYDRSGRSLGTGHVLFDRQGDAVKAQRKYNGVRLDGRIMKITFEGGADGGSGRNGVGPLKRLGQGPRPFGGGSRPFGGGNRNNRGGRGGGRGRGGSGGGARGGKAKVPTAEELDAELDAYVNQVTK